MIAAAKRQDSGGSGAKVTFIPPNCLNHDGLTVDEMAIDDLSDAMGSTVVAPGDSFVLSLEEYAEGSDYTS